VLNEDGSYIFNEITTVPKHVELRISEIVEKIDTYDFSIVSGNIIHKIYDIESIDPEIDAKISQKINDRHPYEELLPDYEVDFNSNSEIKIQNESIELIKKSKLDYIRNYINNIDIDILNEQKLEPDKLFSILKDYYNTIIDEK
jgi:chorismate mutase